METKRCIVVGGGSIALRKIEGLLEASAQVTVISPAFCPEISELINEGKISALERPYQPGDLSGAFLAIAATNDASVNQAIFREANQHGILINTVDDPPHCNFIVPAVIRRGELSLAISTGGGSPALARRLRERLEMQVGPEYGELSALLGELRPELMQCFPAGKARLEAALALVDSDILEVIRSQGRQAAWSFAINFWHERKEAFNVEIRGPQLDA